jgi:hypothetical protein
MFEIELVLDSVARELLVRFTIEKL